jgi:RNA polymerase sigma factor (TIGR02999 family)
MSSPSEVTQLLRRWSDGDREAFDRLLPIVYDRLRQLARQRLRGEAGSQSLNTTGLVHEAYIKLVESPHASVRDRGQFLAFASRVMRNLLVDHARARKAGKRGGGSTPLPLDEAVWVSDERLEALADLHEALERLERLDPRQSQILEQRYFGGLSLEETAEATGLSLATVKRELRFARAWISRELGEEGPSGTG